MKRHIKKPSRSAACTGKVKQTPEGARLMVERLSREQGALMTAYACPYGCRLPGGAPAFHIGHSLPARF